MQGNEPGMGYGLPPAGNGPQSQQPGPNMQSGPLPPEVPFAPAPRRTSRLAVVLGAIAVVLAGAALVVSLVRKPEAQSPTQQTPTPTATAPSSAQQIFNADADRALCEAIAPLMKDIAEQNRVFAALIPGSPEQGNAIPAYKAFIEGWAEKTQAELNKFASPPRFLTRTLQSYIDDKLLYVEMVQPGHVDPFDEPTWTQASIDAGGPLSTCSKFGITWS
jgi:hypothetical protein